MRTSAEIQAALAERRAWLEEHESCGGAEVGIELGWEQALEWVLSDDDQEVECMSTASEMWDEDKGAWVLATDVPPGKMVKMRTVRRTDPGAEDFPARLKRIVSEIDLADDFSVVVSLDPTPEGRWYFQIQCWRKDVITGEMGYGYGGKAYLSPHATDSELIQTVWGLYQSYWLHEARESFQWRGRRIFGPHIAAEALWEVARRVDVRSANHVEDRS